MATKREVIEHGNSLVLYFNENDKENESFDAKPILPKPSLSSFFLAAQDSILNLEKFVSH